MSLGSSAALVQIPPVATRLPRRSSPKFKNRSSKCLLSTRPPKAVSNKSVFRVEHAIQSLYLWKQKIFQRESSAKMKSGRASKTCSDSRQQKRSLRMGCYLSLSTTMSPWLDQSSREMGSRRAMGKKTGKGKEGSTRYCGAHK